MKKDRNKRRIIISVWGNELSDLEALDRVTQVVESGKISKYKETEQYCFVTSFNDGSVVYARDKKNINTDSFVVSK